MDQPGSLIEKVRTIKEAVATEDGSCRCGARADQENLAYDLDRELYDVCTCHSSVNGGSPHLNGKNGKQHGSDSDREEEFWRHMCEMRRDIIGLSEDEARESTYESRRRRQELSEGIFSDPDLEEIAARFTIGETPMTPEEQEFWNRSVELGIRILSLTQAEAEALADHAIERDRQNAFLLKMAKETASV